MADDALLSAEASDVAVARIASTDSVETNEGFTTVTDPVPSERPRRATPDLVRAEGDERRAGVERAEVRCAGGRYRIEGGGDDGAGARLAEGVVDVGDEVGGGEL